MLLNTRQDTFLSTKEQICKSIGLYYKFLIFIFFSRLFGNELNMGEEALQDYVSAHVTKGIKTRDLERAI